MKLEICANSLESALNAQAAGADRIELCSELSLGGITPSLGLLKTIKEHISIPVHVLIRPRSGDFHYNEFEFQQMKRDVEYCKQLGFQGIVSGVLLEDESIDIERTAALIELSKPLSFTFHRAFDCLPNPKDGLESLIKIGVDRILSSGQKATAIEGIHLLKELQRIAAEKLIIVPGSGISIENLPTFKDWGFQEVHTSASTVKHSKKPFFDQTEQSISDYSLIKELVRIRNL